MKSDEWFHEVVEFLKEYKTRLDAAAVDTPRMRELSAQVSRLIGSKPDGVLVSRLADLLGVRSDDAVVLDEVQQMVANKASVEDRIEDLEAQIENGEDALDDERSEAAGLEELTGVLGLTDVQMALIRGTADPERAIRRELRLAGVSCPG